MIYYYPTYIPFQILPIFPIIKCPLWHLFLWSRSKSRITHFFGCHVSCLLYSRMVSQLLFAFYKIHILEYRLVVYGTSFSWVSLIISPGYFSQFPRALPHVWSGTGPSSSVCLADLTALHMAATSATARFKRRPSSLLTVTTQILSGLWESALQYQGLSLQTLNGCFLIPHSTPEARLQLFNRTSFNVWG